MFDKATFLSKASTFRRKPLDLGELGTVHVREFSAAESKRVSELQETKGKEMDAMTLVAITAICDEDGRPLFDASDAAAIKQWPIRILSAVSKTSGDLSKWGDDKKDEGEKKDESDSPTP